MFLQKSKKFHIVLSFEANGLTLNYQYSSILSKLTPKFETCMNTYSWNGPNLEENGQSMDSSGISKYQTTQLKLQ